MKDDLRSTQTFSWMGGNKTGSNTGTKRSFSNGRLDSSASKKQRTDDLRINRRKAYRPSPTEILRVWKDAYQTAMPINSVHDRKVNLEKGGRNLQALDYKKEYFENKHRQVEEFHRENPDLGSFMSRQNDVKSKMITVLFDWLVEVNLKFRSREHTLWLAFIITNRYLANVNDVLRGTLQLIGSSALWIASKYVEVYPGLSKDFVYISDNAFTRAELLEQEKEICRVLKFDFHMPTPRELCARYTEVATVNCTPKHKTRIKFLALYGLERAMMDYRMYNFTFSELAVGALACAMSCTGNQEHWTDEVAEITGYRLDNPRVRIPLRRIRHIVLEFSDKRNKGVISKYSVKKRGGVSQLRIRPPSHN